MHFTTATVAALALVQMASAAPAVAARDAHELDFRSFGVAGCHDENQGVYTLLASQSGECYTFADTIGSILVSDNLCTLHLYKGSHCANNGHDTPTGVCTDGAWKSYKMTC